MNKKIITLLIALTVVLFGCSQSQGNNAGESTPFIGGSTGISANFEIGAPPDEFYDASSGNSYPFDINLMINNVGETDIQAQNLYMKISGLLPSDFGIANPDQMTVFNPVLIEGTEKDSDGNILEGTELDMGVNGLVYQGELTGNIPFPIRSELCYLYQTKANIKMCYKQDLTDVRDIRICNPREPKEVFNSGAPVHVADFEQNVIGTNKISMTFTVQKSGNGNIYMPGFNDGGYTCAWGDPAANWNLPVNKRDVEDRVTVTIDTGIAETLDCPSLTNADCTQPGRCVGEVKLYNNQRVIRCNQDVTTTIDFEKVANIYLDYNFEQSLEKTILGKHGI